jgi:hypothetical protein
MINIDSRLLGDVDANEFLLLAYLTSKVNEDRVCWYGNKAICRDLKWSMVRLQTTKRRLIEKGLLEVEKRFKENSPAQTSNYYKVLTPLTSNYTPTLKLGTGGTSKLDRGDTSKLGMAPVSNLGMAPTSKLGNEVLNNEELATEELVSEELEKDNRYLSYCEHSIFSDLVKYIFTQFEEYSHCMAGYSEVDELKELTSDLTIRKSLKKILEAARAINSAFMELKRPLPEWRETAGFPGTDAGEINPLLEARDQISAYADFCRLTGTFIVTDPEKLPEKLVTTDWCKKLIDHVKPNIEKEKYDPAADEELLSQWLVEFYYWQPLDVYVCKRYNNRIVYGGEEYLKVK